MTGLMQFLMSMGAGFLNGLAQGTEQHQASSGGYGRNDGMGGQRMAALCDAAGLEVTKVDGNKCRFQVMANGGQRVGGGIIVGHLATVFMMCRQFYPRRGMPYGLRKLVGEANRNGGNMKFDINDDPDGCYICAVWKGNVSDLNPSAMQEFVGRMVGALNALEEAIAENGWGG